MKREISWLVILYCLTSCARENDVKPLIEFYSKDRQSGVFISNTNMSSGSISSGPDGVVEKGIEGKGKAIWDKNPSAKCVMGDRFAIAIPTEYGLNVGRAQCWFGQFRIMKCGDPKRCDDFLVQQMDERVGPEWYSFSRKKGVTKLSYDPRGIYFNTLMIDGNVGLK